MAQSPRRRAWAAQSRSLPALAAGIVLTLAAAAGTGGTASAAGAGSAGTGVGTGAAAQDVEDEPGMVMLLDSVDPVLASPGDPVTLRGRVVNESSTTARVSSVTLTASNLPLGSRSAVQDWLDGSGARETGWLLGDDTVGPVVRAGGEVEFSVTVPASITEWLPAGPSVLAVALTAAVEGDAATDPQPAQQAQLRSVLLSTGEEPVDEPLEAAWVVPVTLPADPDLANPDPAAHAAAWVAAVGADSAVRNWLDLLDIPEVTYVVDPATLAARRPEPAITLPADVGDDDETTTGTDPAGQTEEPTTPAPAPDDGRDFPEDATATSAPTPGPAATGGPDATDDDGTGQGDPDDGTAGPDEADLERTLTGIRSALLRVEPHQLWWLPTDDPDLASLLYTSPPREITDDLLDRTPASSQRAPGAVSRLLVRGRADLAWPAMRAPTGQDVARIQDLFAGRHAGAGTLSGVVVPRESLTGDSAAPPRRGAVPLVEPQGMHALGADSWTSALVAASRDEAAANGAGAATARLLAHTLSTYLEDPGAPRELVVAPPRGSAMPPAVLEQLSRGWRQAPWLEAVPAGELIERAEGAEPVSLSGVGPQQEVLGGLAAYLQIRPGPVGTARAPTLVALHRDLDALGEVLADTDALDSWRPVAAGLWSTRWRDDPQGWRETWERLLGEVRETRDGISVTPSSVNFLTNQGTMQVTVVNELDVAVEDVHLVLRPDNPRLLQVVRQPDPLSIGPGSRATVAFEARALTRGETVVTAHVLSEGGTELGEPAQMAVRVQPPGVWIYWVLGGLAGLVLVLGLWRALRGAPRRVARPAPERTLPRSDPGGPARPDPAQESPT